MRRSLAISLLAVLVTLGVAMPAQARSISAGACKIKHVKLVDANAYVVVAEIPSESVQQHHKFFPNERIMCDVAVGTWRALAQTDIDPSYDILRISGHFVGFSGSATACEDCSGDDSFVGVKNAASGHTAFLRYMHPTESDDTDGFGIPDMTLKPNGSVAFTVIGNWRQGWKASHSVVRHDLCDGTRVLDSSNSVRVQSLKRRGSQLRWRHGRRLRTAKLC